MNKMYQLLSESMSTKISTNNKLGTIGAKDLYIDFDGVVHRYSEGFKDGFIYDIPMEGCKEALQILSNKFNLVLFSARISAQEDGNGKQDIIDWLEKYGLSKYFSKITDVKGPAVAYIDDMAIRHTDWNTTMAKLEELGHVQKTNLQN